MTDTHPTIAAIDECRSEIATLAEASRDGDWDASTATARLRHVAASLDSLRAQAQQNQHHQTDQSERIEELLQVQFAIAGLDFQSRTSVRGDGTLIDALAASTNMLSEELEAAQLALAEQNQRLRSINTQLEKEIRDRKLIEEGLQEARSLADGANEAKGQFLANMSHEIRTPMNAIIGLTELALFTDLESPTRDTLLKVRKSARSLLVIINDILDFSRIEAGMLELVSGPFDLRVVVDSVLDMVASGASEKGLELLADIEPDVPCALVGDAVRIGQVLTNLASNAVKFTNTGDVLLRVHVVDKQRDRARLRFAIMDTGVGISADAVETLFDAFTQVDGSMTRSHSGSGLGLSISQQLVALLGGELQVKTEVGLGSTFSFEIEIERQPVDREELLFLPEELNGLRILVVDDHRISREVLTGVIDHMGFEAVSVDDGRAAIEELLTANRRGARYALVLLDWKMPGLDGVETARQIEGHPELLGALPKVIMVTAHAREAVLQRAANLRLEAVLTKPVSPSRLFDSIMTALGRTGMPLGRLRRPALAAELAAAVQGAHLLVVEDVRVNQEVLVGALAFMGVTAEVAESGRHALEVLAGDGQFNAVLMDVQMPEMDGYEATRRIRRDPRHADLPIIATTAHALAGEREKCLATGMSDYISKPIEMSNLLAKLARWITPPTPLATELNAAPAVAPALLPGQVAGIDVTTALRRVGGSPEVLRTVLVHFVEDFAGVAGEIAAARKRGDDDDALSKVHALKGAAANIAATPLWGAAQELEAVLAQESKDEAVEESVDVVRQRLSELLIALQKL